MSGPVNFDRIARAYRWMEYAVMGRALERARERYLHRLGDPRHALVLGDGDGRFTAKLLQRHPGLSVEAVDTSAAMLTQLMKRAGVDAARVRAFAEEGLTYQPREMPDLVVTHFFLDCFEQAEVERLTHRLAGLMAPGGLWLVSEFCVPRGALRLPGRVFIRGLYRAFRLLTGLRVVTLPDHRRALCRAGLVAAAQGDSCRGLLTSELWRKE